MRERSKGRRAAGTFRAGVEITSRSGWVTRDYRLLFLPDRVRVVYADGRIYYDVSYCPEAGEAVCDCPAFAADGHCKHRDALLALLAGLAGRLGRGAA